MAHLKGGSAFFCVNGKIKKIKKKSFVVIMRIIPSIPFDKLYKSRAWDYNCTYIANLQTSSSIISMWHPYITDLITGLQASPKIISESNNGLGVTQP